ncbi:M10 family metallopeptidase C-terminal domain-containing protein [Acuticoccus sp. MNP-M23]|uniref:M10 family metallopeptidase C-terminal domain-containing protein n=1 Tax=Acuticoccus sp. MNP-M23 TaxID=3072793 RepID=UPI0028154DE1|nr:M10 family metallopeptidase C-terminal domain-containing protein [Acuticoccus sp. MNP-M23]WMS44699.1 M10 family metallopeptidase C-terminal domain-containing protein [Acuticoccus sp. MNP-M23]
MAGTATPANVSSSGNTWIDGLLWGTQWSSGGATTVSVCIAGQSGNETVALDGSTVTALGSISPAEIDAMTSAMDAIANVCDITFNIVANQADADIIWATVNNADGHGALGYANPPGAAYNSSVSDFQSIIAVNAEGYVGSSVAIGSYDYVTFIHEFGHAVGLAHPHDGGGTSSTFPEVSGPFGDLGTYDMNQGVYSMMSYNDGWQTAPHSSSVSADFGWAGTPMALDIATLQLIYGATAANTGSDTYTLVGTNASGTYYECIWDTGGTDAIDGVANLANSIDLRAATLLDEVGGGGFVSYAAGIHGGFTIANGVVIENATGGNLADSIIGNSAGNALDGLLGNDVIDGGAGADTVDGGGGADTLTGGTGNDSITGGTEADSIEGGSGNDVLDGGAAGDTFVFSGVFGDDTLSASLDATGTDNVISFGNVVTESMITYALAGNNEDLLITVSGGSGASQQDGTILITGYATAQAAGGGFGSMVWTAGGGGSVDLTAGLSAPPVVTPPVVPPSTEPIIGTNGSTRVNGTSGGDMIDARGGNDRTQGFDGDDTILGGRGHDLVEGGSGADSIDGQADNDSLYGDAGNDTIEGGAGRDKLYGGADDDSLTGATGKDMMYGDDGNDILDGGAHNDKLYGGIGDDSLIGGDGNDLLDGGDGADTLMGGSGSDRLLGGGGNDSMDGGQHADLLDGGDGDDVLLGGIGRDADRLYGSAGSDTLDGARGADKLDGGVGDDVLTGGADGDIFDFVGAFGNDTISDFEDTTEIRYDGLDRIDLTAFRAITGSILNMSDLLLTTSGSDVLIELDLDNDGNVDAEDYDGDLAADTVSILVENTTVGQFSAHDFLF